VNEQLEGGFIRVQAHDLLSLSSRKALEEESWFPTQKGDWVELKDGCYGEVLRQTPEQVVLRAIGGGYKFYRTSDFLSLSPQNYSMGFQVQARFGLDYSLQTVVGGRELPHALILKLKNRFNLEFQQGNFLAVDVRLMSLGQSSLDLEVSLNVNGKNADKRKSIEADLNFAVIEICDQNHWLIPFPQLVVHADKFAER
jgi:small-conductance mechanosensitive channel